MLKLKAQMLAQGLKNHDLTRQFYAAAEDSSLADIMRVRPQIVGALIWPYQCASWNVRERLERILAHYTEIDRLGPPLKFPAEKKLILHDLGTYRAGLRVVLDQPKWFMREGGLTINVFLDSFRAMSLSFSFSRDRQGRLQAFVGSIQGRNREDILDIYRDLTKEMFGLRPRDMLFEYFRLLCRHFGVEEIRGVADADRHHRHPYFGQSAFHLNYDEIWRDRGGKKSATSNFLIPLIHPHRDLEEIKPKKRSLYRKRYKLLDELDARAPLLFSEAELDHFVDT